MEDRFIAALDALQRLKEGNDNYINSTQAIGDISQQKRHDTWANGQKPFAVIVSCSDSRVIPEAIFSVGIGDLFVIRVAGNVVGNYELGSIEYAVDHLGCKLVVVLGHTGCGAVTAALEDNCGYVKFITDEIKRAIDCERDLTKASVLNVMQSARKIQDALSNNADVYVCGALYHTDNGTVDFIK